MSKKDLFQKAAVFTDIHFGNKNNSREFNTDCEKFIDWFIVESRKRNAKTCIFCGDFHHSRSNINVTTLNHSVENLKKLSESFEAVYMLTGNHDLYYRENRDLNSIPHATLFDNVNIINDKPLKIGDTTLVPWLVGDEWKKMKNIKTRYVFGHFELPNFMMNAAISMPDNNTLKQEHFATPEYVFTGHFHARQIKDNIHYIGSPTAHNYADAGDSHRGAMYFEWGGIPEYVDYDNGPRYNVVDLSNLIDNPDIYLDDKTYCRATIDLPISYEEANFLKETFMTQYNPREFSLLPKKNSGVNQIAIDADVQVESIDQIVCRHLESVESDVINRDFLMNLYREL